ncbi:hypothetical protein O181_093731 [Austropuccinia psidii MF-1]|uniref:Vacuolar protein sorting-associated protein 54 C-terminal domain-containing protein n=1 Tax=Austropuccinia psidii MF-1 TaxID=1389203 RepID=A0A9Q3PBS0_9BASI|nr:hypothetical protein [Austropuccinia psidii MF-1]
MEDSKLFILSKQSSVPSELTESPKTIPLSKQLDVEGTPFHTVGAILESLNTLGDYLKIVINCSILTTDTMGKVIEFLKAGLKNITAKHLALASQALLTMISLVPYVRECFRRHLSPKQAIMLVDFDKLKRDYQEHQSEIHAKLVSIMADRLAVYHQTLQAIDWESLKSSLSDPNPYLENLLKEVTTLHRVLSRYLLTSTLQAIMTQVFSAIHLTLSEEFSKANIQSAHAKERLLQDVQFLMSKLNELKAIDEIQEKVKDFQETLNKKLLPKEAESESRLQPINFTIDGNFRARFRFLSPGRPALNSPLPLPAQVKKPSNLSKDLPPTCSETKVAKSKVASEKNQTSSTI